jgi:tRNA-specific 2-thiouridylase
VTDVFLSAPSVLMDQALDRLRRIPGLHPGDRVVAAMSGGIDSSVMAALLHHAGYEVVGISMQLFEKQGAREAAAGRCCTLDDFQDARRVANQLGFPHYVMDYEARFREMVMDPFVLSYLNGETPSPCILCNKYLKFDVLATTAKELGARFVATGHYAKILTEGETYHLLKADDPAKDQSYFLFSHNQETLARTLFPLEFLTKVQVRSLARWLNLPVAEKPESQEICFVSQGRYDKFIEENGSAPKSGSGPIRHVSGNILGQHDGYWRFTIGQRKGLGIAHARPLYVTAIDPLSHTVWVGEDQHLFQSRLEAREATWCQERPVGPIRCLAKLRSRSPEVPAWVEPSTDDRVLVEFDAPQRAITPGQAIVFYQGLEVLGGAWIHSAGPAT